MVWGSSHPCSTACRARRHVGCCATSGMSPPPTPTTPPRSSQSHWTDPGQGATDCPLEPLPGHHLRGQPTLAGRRRHARHGPFVMLARPSIGPASEPDLTFSSPAAPTRSRKTPSQAVMVGPATRRRDRRGVGEPVAAEIPHRPDVEHGRADTCSGVGGWMMRGWTDAEAHWHAAIGRGSS